MIRKAGVVTIVNSVPQRFISVLDRGLAYGDGIFETMMVIGGDIPLWQLHYDRLNRGLSALSISLDISALARQMRTVLANANIVDSRRTVAKLMVTRGESERGYQTPEHIHPNLITILSPQPPNVFIDSGVKVHYCQQRLLPQPLAGIKTLNQLAYVLASQERSGSDCSEGLLFNRQDQLIEATARNVFLVDKDSQLLTPKMDECGIEGVLRRLIIDTIAPELNIDVKQTTITKGDIADAQEIFLTNSVTHIWPVIDCENRKWREGPLTMAIKNRLMIFLRDEKRLSYSEHAEMYAALTLG